MPDFSNPYFNNDFSKAKALQQKIAMTKTLKGNQKQGSTADMDSDFKNQAPPKTNNFMRSPRQKVQTAQKPQ